MQGFKGSDRVSEHYDSNNDFAAVLNRAIRGFKYPDWSHRTIAEVFGAMKLRDRDLAENALNGWTLKETALTERQAQFVSEHSGEQRSSAVREAIASVGAEALKLVRAGDERGACALMKKAGLGDKTINLIVLGWGHESMEHALDEKPAVCCVVNAVSHKTYVGRVVRVADDVIWQEVEPGEIVEHGRDKLGALPEAMLDPLYRQPIIAAGEIANPWVSSWYITYADAGQATIKTAALCLLDSNSIKPNPFKGCVVSETASRFVQENGNDVYSGHLKEMTGELSIGEAYEITYRGPIGQQVAEVKTRELVAEKSGKQLMQPIHSHEMPIADALLIGTDIYKKLSVIVAPQDVIECLAERRRNGSFSGQILDVDQERRLVVQATGRQQATVHRLGDFSQVPVAGTRMDIKYRDGKLAMAQERVQTPAIGR